MKTHLFTLVMEYLACLELAEDYSRKDQDLESYHRSDRFKLHVEYKTQARQTRRCMGLIGYSNGDIVCEIHSQKAKLRGDEAE